MKVNSKSSLTFSKTLKNWINLATNLLKTKSGLRCWAIDLAVDPSPARELRYHFVAGEMNGGRSVLVPRALSSGGQNGGRSGGRSVWISHHSAYFEWIAKS